VQLERHGVRVIERSLGCIDVAVNAQSALVVWSEAMLAKVAAQGSDAGRQDAIIDQVRQNVAAS
jgi:hypothetical protein